MNKFLEKISLTFSAGALGGLTDSIAVWLFGTWGITAALGVKIAPEMTSPWLYPRIVWGGLWGFLFLIPLLKRNYLWRGLIFSLGPTLVQLFVVFPVKAQKGSMGLELGVLTPLFVIFYNAVWGWTTAIWLKWTGKSSSR